MNFNLELDFINQRIEEIDKRLIEIDIIRKSKTTKERPEGYLPKRFGFERDMLWEEKDSLLDRKNHLLTLKEKTYRNYETEIADEITTAVLLNLLSFY